MERHYGRCALCGKEGELTFEHIPPRSAFNSLRTKMYTGDQLLADINRMPFDVQGLQYRNRQKGSGLFSLCQSCNNLTGTWYGDSYRDMAQIIVGAIESWNEDPVEAIGIRDVYVGRFIKQVISMFCSVNNYESLNPYRHINQVNQGGISPLLKTMCDAQVGLSRATNMMDELRSFVLDKDAVGLDRNRFKIYMYLTKSPFVKFNTLSSLINLETNSYIILSEITAFPFGFLLYFDPPDGFSPKGIDITPMADSGYEVIATIEFPFRFLEMNTYLPGDYRTKEEIEREIKESGF